MKSFTDFRHEVLTNPGIQAAYEAQAGEFSSSALMARQVEVLRCLDAMLADPQRYPSLPMIARQLQVLTEAVAALQHDVTVLKDECHALRQRELLRLWETTDEGPTDARKNSP
jgi:hypothetical protein